MLGAAVGQPDQRRLRDQVVRELWERDPAGDVERDLAADPEDRPIVHGDDFGLDRLFALGRGVVTVDVDGAPDVFLEQLLRAEQVVLVILLEKLKSAAERPDVNRLGLDRRGHVAVLELDETHDPYRHRAHLTNEPDCRRLG